MIPMKKEDVNKKYTPTWVYCNDNSRSAYYREKFTEVHGGKFVKQGRTTFIWEDKEVPKEPVQIRRKFIFEDKNGVTYMVDNMYEFCNTHNLTRPAMYDLMAGNRAHHKGFKFKGEIPWVRPGDDPD